jgi:hypothetical protein
VVVSIDCWSRYTRRRRRPQFRRKAFGPNTQYAYQLTIEQGDTDQDRFLVLFPLLWAEAAICYRTVIKSS